MGESFGEYDSLVRDVCRIFNEVTKMASEPVREAAVITHYAKKHKWGRYEFRVIIEHQHAHDEFLKQPGRMNLRSMLNPAGEGRLLDLLVDLKFREEVNKVKASLKAERKEPLVYCKWSRPTATPPKLHPVPLSSIHCPHCIKEKYLPEILFSPYEAEKIWAGVDEEMVSIARWFKRMNEESLIEYAIRTHPARREIYLNHGLPCGQIKDIVGILGGVS